jgi:hypothetical protein
MLMLQAVFVRQQDGVCCCRVLTVIVWCMKTFTAKWNKALLIVLLLGAVPDNVEQCLRPH